MLNRSRTLRKQTTPAEHRLWYFLRGRRFLQYKFKRQQVIGPYIVDFICHWKKLIIELDGGQHSTAIDYDEKRTVFLNSKKFKVLRFWNNEVFEKIDVVLEVILVELERKL